MTITAAESTDLFTGSADDPLQVVRVTVSTPASPTLSAGGRGSALDTAAGRRCGR